MTDRELLELAAKAVGLSVEHFNAEGLWQNPEFTWNPLTRDDDALRLAVRLGIRILHPCAGSTTGYPNAVSAGTLQCGEAEEFYEDHDGDAYAATRRAIVRAAAAIGEGMP